MTRTSNAFGIELRYVDDDTARRAIANRGALAAQIDNIHAQASRDAAIAVASGRWAIGRPDPDTYVPGDAVALRSLAIGADLITLRRNLALLSETPASDAQREAQYTAVANTLLAVGEHRALYDAVPHWLDAATAAGILDSTPPAEDVIAELRLPYPRVLMVFERRFELPAEVCDWPPAWDHSRDPWSRARGRRTSIGDIRALGGALEGLVLTEAPSGGLGDEVIWLVSTNPDPALPMPLAQDRYRSIVWGRLRSSRLAPVAHNLAAGLCWAEWRQPSRSLNLPEDIESRQWRKTVRRGEFRRHEPAGAAAGVHVIDLKRSPVQREPRQTLAGDHARRPAITHLRRAHWRLQPVGPGRSQRRVVRVAATVVNPGVGVPATPVYRVPMPDKASPVPPTEAEPPPPTRAAAGAVIDLRTLPLRRPQPEPPRRPNPAAPEVSL